jgi:hypothetical protein
MTKEQLLAFIRSKAEVQKKMLYDIARAQTSEVEQSQLPQLIESLSQGIENKRAKLQKLEDQRKNLELEITGLETAEAVTQQKLKKRKGQVHDSELEVKTLREKLVEIQKRITPELIKNLNKLLDKNEAHQNLQTMVTAFSSLINMNVDNSFAKARIDFKTHSNLIEKMINAMATNF